MFDFFYQGMCVFGYVWLIIGVLFLLFEVGTPGLFLFTSLSVGSFIAAILAFMNFGLQAQCLVALVTAVIAFVVLRWYIVQRRPVEHKSNIDALVGQDALVTVSIAPHKVGRVKVGGEEWPAMTMHGNAYQKGTVVIVVALQGNKLVVQ